MNEVRRAFADQVDRLLDGRDLGKLAATIGLRDSSALSHYRTGRREPNLQRLVLLARELEVSVDTLLGVAQPEPITLPTPVGPAEYVPVPLLEAPVAAGPHTWNEEKVKTWHCLPRAWIEERARGRVVRCRVSETEHEGTSMASTILPGAVLTLDLGQRTVEPGGVYVVRDAASAAMVKRVYPMPGERALLCVSDNHAFKPFELTLTGGARVIGRVLRWEQGEDW